MSTSIYLPPEPEFDEPSISAVVIPHSREAEGAVIGAVFINPEIFLELALFLKSSHFYIHRLGWIYRTFENLSATGTPFDLLTVSDELGKNNLLTEIGGPAYLTSLVNQVPSSLNAVSYGEIVHQNFLRREGLRVANDIASAAHREGSPFEPEKFALQLSDLSISNKNTDVDVIEELRRNIYESNSFTYGVNDLDNRLGGKFRKELEIFAGDQGTGKTSKMFTESLANADNGHRVVLCSLEMGEASLWAKRACGEMGVSWNQVRAKKVKREISDSVFDLAKGYKETYKGRIIIYEAPMSLSNIVAAGVKEKPDMLYIDHVFLLEGMQENSNAIENINQLNTATRTLKQRVAKPLNCNVTLLWQLGKSFAKEKRKPGKHDLYLAGTRDPDSILIFYRPDQYQPEGITPEIVDVEVIVAKARNDYSGNGISMKYNLVKQTFHGLARVERE